MAKWEELSGNSKNSRVSVSFSPQVYCGHLINLYLHKLVDIEKLHEEWSGVFIWLFCSQQRHIWTYLDCATSLKMVQVFQSVSVQLKKEFSNPNVTYMWRALIYNMCGDWKTVSTCTMKYCLETLQDRKFYEVMSVSALLPPCMVWTIKFLLHKLVHVGIFHEYWTGLHCIGYFTISRDKF